MFQTTNTPKKTRYLRCLPRSLDPAGSPSLVAGIVFENLQDDIGIKYCFKKKHVEQNHLPVPNSILNPLMNYSKISK